MNEQVQQYAETIARRGTLWFDSETGTEGGWYAWQDAEHQHGGTPGDPCPWDHAGCPVAAGFYHQHASRDGLQRFKNGDHVRIFSPEDGTVVWEGFVRLTRRNDVYENPEASVFGLWVNQEPDVGVERETWAKWFLNELPCEVTPSENDGNAAE